MQVVAPGAQVIAGFDALMSCLLTIFMNSGSAGDCILAAL